MGILTYLPTLFFIVDRICKYTARYDTTIRANLSGDAENAYNVLRAACDAFRVFNPEAD